MTSMITIKDFLLKCKAYFGGFENEAVADEVARELRYIKPADYDRLYRQLMISTPATWKPDYKAVMDAIYKLKLDRLEQPGVTKTCPVCKTVNHSNSCCPVCKYDTADGDPNEYRKFWESWKSGENEHVDVQEIISDLAEAKRSKE